jgi:hypothetical protein
MALQIIPTQDYAVSEPFGVRGLAELILRAMVNDQTISLDFAYSPAAAQSLRKAASKLKDSDGVTFTFERMGDTYREVSYPVTKRKSDGSASTFQITRQYLNVAAIRVTNVQAEADAAIAADNA